MVEETEITAVAIIALARLVELWPPVKYLDFASKSPAADAPEQGATRER